MPASLRAVANLKAAKTIIGVLIAGGVLLAAGGAGTPIILGMAQDKVLEVLNLKDSYVLSYGETLDLEDCTIIVGNEFNKNGKSIEGKNLQIEGFDSEYIGVKEVVVSYLNFSKKVNVTINPAKLATPSPVFNNATGILSWEPVTNGADYTVVLTDSASGQEISRSTIQEKSFNLNNIQFFTSFKVSVTSENSKKGSNGVSCFISSDASEPQTLQKLRNISNVRYEGGKVKWDAISDITNYEVHINGMTFSPTDPEVTYDMTAAGNYAVSVRGIAGAGAYATPTEVTFVKLPAPQLSFNGTEIVVTGGQNVSYLLDGEPFSGDVNSITEVGAHVVTAYNVPSVDNELRSEVSNSLNLTKLSAPVLSLTAGKLSCTGIGISNIARYFDNGNPFDGELSSITGEGSHTITAKQAGSGNQILSAASNEIVITKRSAPIATFDGKDVAFSNKSENFRVIVDGERREYTEVTPELIEVLSDSKTHSIAGVNLGNGNDILDSDPSNEVSFVVPKINVSTSYEKFGESDLAKIRIAHEIADRDLPISATVKIEYFAVSPEDGAKVSPDAVDTNFVVSKDSPAIGPREYNMRGAKVVRFTIDLNDVEGLQMYKTRIVKDVTAL